MSVALLNEQKYQELYWGLAERYVKLCGKVVWHINEPTFLLRIFEPKCKHSLAEAPFINEEGLKNIKFFVMDLYLVNELAFKDNYNHRYDNEITQTHIKLTNLKMRPKHLNNCTLLKCLHCIKYNSDEAREYNTKNTFDILDKLIEGFTTLIIDSLPEYQKAEWF